MTSHVVILVRHTIHVAKAILEMAAQMPEVAVRLEVFPRDMGTVLLYGLEIPIIPVRGLTQGTAERYLCALAGVTAAPDGSIVDRRLYGLLHVGPPSTTVLIEAGLSPSLTRYVLAHEIGHVIADVISVRQLWMATLPTQRAAIQRFFAWQTAEHDEWLDLAAAIKGLPERPATLLNERDNQTYIDREIQADLIAREILAPWDIVVREAAMMSDQDLASLLIHVYDLPQPIAWSYGQDLRRAIVPSPDVADRLFGHLIARERLQP